ncbi:MAG: hypothetical protein ACK4G1_08150, partial [Ignavibacteria bacterium]
MKKILLLIIFFTFISTGFSQVIFESNFDSGNLQSVSTTDSINFLVRLNADIVGRWFYFKMKN